MHMFVSKVGSIFPVYLIDTKKLPKEVIFFAKYGHTVLK